MLQLSASADERSVEPSLETRSVGANAEQPVGDERLRLALGFDRLDRLELQRSFGELPRGVPDEDVARLRRLFESRGDADRITCRKCAALAGHDLAGVDPHPDLQLDAELALKISVEAAELVAQLVRGAGGSQRIVLVDAAGIPKTAMTASPMNFSTLPPCRSSTSRARAK